MPQEIVRKLRFGWTTGCCATAAACAAFEALVCGECPKRVTVTLPGGQTPDFAVAFQQATPEGFCAGVIKDAGDDPDVTDGALVQVTVAKQSTPGVCFAAGAGVGTVTRAGLLLAVGEPAINPKPREMITANLVALAQRLGQPLAIRITISIPGGSALAEKTWNLRLGIVGGLSVLGTSGIVRPYSCSAWIHSIHRGIDVARANGWPLVLASTGNTSEKAAQKILGIDDSVSLEMGDFAGATLKYLVQHPIPNFVVAGGFAKMVKIAQGAKNLHSKHSQVDQGCLAQWATEQGAEVEAANTIRYANTALEAAQFYPPLAEVVAARAWAQISIILPPEISVRTMVFARDGALLAEQRASDA
ncbi:MAG: cobalt-precorrin-5B (C(1))-methyltransferase [Alphaproteobacteria bacterium]|nr:cobalt-precorrin-5B (C(1))-methyltransferase [Alphaproteobacteria bacterium]